MEDLAIGRVSERAQRICFLAPTVQSALLHEAPQDYTLIQARYYGDEWRL